MRKKRNRHVNWDKHEHIREYQGEFMIDRLKVPGTCMKQVNFINGENRLLVTGDFGDWLFCREFHPSEEGWVSDGYWLEKLRISNPYIEFKPDWEEIEKAVRKFPETWVEEGNEMTGGIRDWLEELEVHIADRWKAGFLHVAHGAMPDELGGDHDNVPDYKQIPARLDIIFDAFDEICRRMESDSKNSEGTDEPCRELLMEGTLRLSAVELERLGDYMRYKEKLNGVRVTPQNKGCGRHTIEIRTSDRDWFMINYLQQIRFMTWLRANFDVRGSEQFIEKKTMRNNHERPWWEKDEWLKDKATNDPVLVGIFKRIRVLQVSPEEEQLLFWRELAKHKTERVREYFDEMVKLRINGIQPAHIVVPEGGSLTGEQSNKVAKKK